MNSAPAHHGSIITVQQLSDDVPVGKYHDDIAGVLIDHEQLHHRIGQLAEEIGRYYESSPRPLLVLTVLKGAVLFVSDLVQQISVPTQLEFMAVSSYGSGSSSSGVVRILKDLDRNIEGLDVLIVEDIIDSGLTLSWLMKNLATRNPHSLKVCTLLRKPDSIKNANAEAEFIGFDIPDDFVVGYGLDYDESFRDLPYIGVLKQHVYAQ